MYIIIYVNIFLTSIIKNEQNYPNAGSRKSIGSGLKTHRAESLNSVTNSDDPDTDGVEVQIDL